MSEKLKNRNEVFGAWFSLVGSTVVIIFSISMLILGAGAFSTYPGSFLDYQNALGLQGVQTANFILIAWIFCFISAFGGGMSLLVSLYRRKLGVTASGTTLFVSFVIVAFSLFFFLLSLINVQNDINLTISDYDLLQTVQITIPITFWLALVSSFTIILGAFYMFAARPIPVAKFKKKRMGALTKADSYERTGKPILAIKFYNKAADLSMKLKEEDKATEYYAKARDIHENAVEKMLKEEEERKRAELAARRAKLEEERKEILQKADDAEEEQDYQRAFHLYREAADRSVDLGQKKLAAQFTAKSKELLRKAKDFEKQKAKKKEEEKKRQADYERKKKEMEKKADKM